MELGEKVCFKDLSIPLKVLVVCCWIIVFIYFLAFTFGVMMGIAGMY